VQQAKQNGVFELGGSGTTRPQPAGLGDELVANGTTGGQGAISGGPAVLGGGTVEQGDAVEQVQIGAIRPRVPFSQQGGRRGDLGQTPLPVAFQHKAAHAGM
jgi:hypothetical protein